MDGRLTGTKIQSKNFVSRCEIKIERNRWKIDLFELHLSKSKVA